jgi:hypothetical protein
VQHLNQIYTNYWLLSDTFCTRIHHNPPQVQRHDWSQIRGSNYYERARIAHQSRPRFGKVLWFAEGGRAGGGLYAQLTSGYLQQARSFSVELWCSHRGLHDRRQQVT